MNFEQSLIRGNEDLERDALIEQVGKNSKLKKFLRSSLKECVVDNLKRCKENAAEIGLSLGTQLSLVAMFLNENIGDLNSYFDIPGTNESIFIDKRMMAMILSSVLVKSARGLKDYLEKHGQSVAVVE